MIESVIERLQQLDFWTVVFVGILLVATFILISRWKSRKSKATK